MEQHRRQAHYFSMQRITEGMQFSGMNILLNSVFCKEFKLFFFKSKVEMVYKFKFLSLWANKFIHLFLRSSSQI